MAVQENEARYQTCECILRYQWDDTVLPTLRVHTGSQAIFLCPRHQGALAPLAFANATADNRVKNNLFALIVAVKPSITPEDYLWSLRLDRVLEVKLPFTPAEKGLLIAAANANFGAGKVVAL